MEKRSRGPGVGRCCEVSWEVERGVSESFDEASTFFFDLISITGVGVSFASAIRHRALEGRRVGTTPNALILHRFFWQVQRVAGMAGVAAAEDGSENEDRGQGVQMYFEIFGGVQRAIRCWSASAVTPHSQQRNVLQGRRFCCCFEATEKQRHRPWL